MSFWLIAGGLVMGVLAAVLGLWWRWDDVVTAVIPWGLVLSAAIAVLLGISGWYGGELAYRHKVGVEDGA